jgi:hypothetical protein
MLWRVLKSHKLTSIVQYGSQMPKYLVVCPSCNSEFLSYEEYISHVFEKYEDQPSVRMQPKIMNKEINET